MITLGDRLRAANNRPVGFDYLRVLLSFAVLAWHTIIVCYGRDAENIFWLGPLRPLPFVVVPSFFALSGFLVAGSLERNDLPSFLTLRALRIFPALIVEVLLSALILGPLLTTVPLGQYFTNFHFYTYFLNVTGFIHYFLPGVFINNVAGPIVNLQLWTIPFELDSYIAISLIYLVGMYKRPMLFVAFVGCFSVGMFLYQNLAHDLPPIDVRPQGRMSVIAFLFGAALYRLRDRVAWSGAAFLASVAASWMACLFPQTGALAPLPIAYMTVYLGLTAPPRTLLLKGADYSYGVYLYGFPIQQAVSLLFPAYRVWYFNLIVSLAVAGGMAFLSWTLVESKVLAHRAGALRVVGDFCRGVRQSRIVRFFSGRPAAG